MLDNRCSALLNIINNECKGGEYKIIGIEELRLAMPAHFGETNESIEKNLQFLCARDYISIKYQDEREVCLIPLSKGRLVYEKQLEEEIDRAKNRKTYFFSSFIGGFLGGLIGGVICLMILLFGGK